MGGSTLHYRCAFDLRSSTTGAAWSDVPGLIRRWIGSKETDLDLKGRWYFSGGRAEGSDRGRTAVYTDREIGNGTEENPQFWAVRYDHPCSQIAFRQWRTDVGVTRIGDALRLSLLTRHWLRDGYIGEEPPQPMPSAPGVIGRILRSKDWHAYAGSQRLSDVAVKLPPGQGPFLKAILEDPLRQATVVLVTREFATETALLDSARLARLLAGVAVVLEATTAEVNKEIEWVLPKAFRCWDGMVRAYFPALRFDRDSDGRRHRYFYPEQIKDLTAAAVEDRLVAGIARRSGIRVDDSVTTLEDLLDRRHEHRLAELRKAADDTSLKEYVGLLEADNRTLGMQLSDRAQEIAFVTELNDDLTSRVDALEEELAKISHERQYWMGEALTATQRLEMRSRALESLGTLPETLAEALPLLEGLCEGRLVFSERARRSAEKASSYDLGEVWTCLWAMGTTLPKLFFEHTGRVDVEAEFRLRTGFALALSESSETKKDKALMRLRKDSFEGRETDIAPHVKVGSTVRIHFCVDRDKQRLIVGHCGDHLDTAGTRRMS